MLEKICQHITSIKTYFYFYMFWIILILIPANSMRPPKAKFSKGSHSVDAKLVHEITYFTVQFPDFHKQIVGLRKIL